jgi:hypothetical protein
MGRGLIVSAKLERGQMDSAKGFVASLFKGKGGVACLFKGKRSWPDYFNQNGSALMISAKTGRDLFI